MVRERRQPRCSWLPFSASSVAVLGETLDVPDRLDLCIWRELAERSERNDKEGRIGCSWLVEVSEPTRDPGEVEA